MAIAIVGSGPAGCYMADMLARALPNETIDIFERQSEPFGLVRYGVAPDHHGTKAVGKLFARTLGRPNVRLMSNSEVGHAISIEQLRVRYRILVIATGAGSGRVPDFPGVADLPMLTGLQLAGLFNGRDLHVLAGLPRRAGSIAIFGNGNVSLDAARLLAKPAAQLAEVGVRPDVLDWRDGLGLQEIHIIGRGNAAQTRFGHNELREIGSLAGFRPVVSKGDLDGASGSNPSVLPVLQDFASLHVDDRKPIRFHFGCHLQGYANGALTVVKGTHCTSVQTDLAVSAIGQRAGPVPGLPYNEDTGCIPNRDGAVIGMENVFVVGWAASPAGGSIPASRQAAAALLPKLLAASGADSPASNDDLQNQPRIQGD